MAGRGAALPPAACSPARVLPDSNVTHPAPPRPAEDLFVQTILGGDEACEHGGLGGHISRRVLRVRFGRSA